MCKEDFVYKEEQTDFTKGSMGVKFPHLKHSLRRHLKSGNHKSMMKEAGGTEIDEKEDARNTVIGRTNGGLVYHLVYNARPDDDLPLLIYRVKRAGGDVGDCNHSSHLVSRLLPEIAGAVSGRLKEYLSSPMVATGCLPPVNIMADKATDKRDTRHLIGLLTYNPGGPTLFKAFFLGAPKCAGGTGDILTESILTVVDPYLKPSQYCGFSGDGVYKHTKVPEKLDRHFGRRGVFTHDLMHQAALVDTFMRNPKAAHSVEFSWLNTLTQTIGSGVSFIQWGKEWAHYFRLYTEMVEEGREARVLRPKTFSETKMANHSRAVYARFREIVPALLSTLEEVKQEWAREGGSHDKEKALKADAIMAKIYNTIFLLTLSLLVDIYTIYSIISENLQVVNRLAFDRKDIFDRQVKKLEKMMTSVEVAKCPCSKEKEEEVCLWPVLHRDIKELQEKSMYRGVLIGCLAEEGSKTRVGTEQTKRVALLDLEKVVETVTKRAVSVVSFLCNGLSTNVYSNNDIIYLDNIRRLLDLKLLIAAIEQSSAASVSSNRYRSWLDAAKFVEPDLFARITADELRMQYREFVRRLGQLATTLSTKDNTEIFGLFLDPNLNHFKDIESVLSVMARAGVAMGLESVVESWVSVLEHHHNPRRPLTQERLEQEAMVALNGPAEVHCDSIVDEALASFWRKQKVAGNRDGHWIRRSTNIKSYFVSGAVDSIVKKTVF